MVDYRLKQVFIFVVFNLFMTVKTQNSLDMCEFGVKDVDDGESGYLTYDRSMLYPDPMTISGTCICVISAENRDPDTKIATIYETKICGTACCTEQLLIDASTDAGSTSYDSCTSDIGTADGDCVTIPPTVLSNPRPISDQESIKIQFSFATQASSEQVTDSFTLRIQVADTFFKHRIRITCLPPSFTSPSSTSGTSTTETAETPATSDIQTPQTTASNNLTTFYTITSVDSHSTDDTSGVLIDTTTFQSDDQESNIGLIVGVSVGSVCIVIGVILVIIFVKRGRSKKSPPRNGVDQNIYGETPNPDSFSTELVDNAMYSSQTPDNQLSANTTIVDNPQYGLQTSGMQSPDTYIVDNPQYSSTQNTHPGLYTAGTDLIENKSYMEANMNHIGHHMIISEQDNATYSDVENPSVNNGGFKGPYENMTHDVYDGGSKLVDNVIYNNDPQMPESDVFYSGGTEIVDNTMYG